MTFSKGDRVHLPVQDLPHWVTVRHSLPGDDGGWTFFVSTEDGDLREVPIRADVLGQIVRLDMDAGAPSERVLAGVWTRWMSAAALNAHATLLASTPLRPYVHQSNAVYGAMLPQPRLRFLLADEPGTGKTIMAGLYLREMQKFGFVRRGLVVAPANLVRKWQDDFDRFFGGDLRRITASTVHEHALDVEHDLWVVSLELAAVNANVQQAIRPDQAGWDVVVFDEAHRLTPTAQTFHAVGRLLARDAPRVLMMTATPHRGSEWLFRHLLHLVDPEIYPDPGADAEQALRALKPGSIHFLRRMKEDLVDYDGVTPLFKGRRATNLRVPLSGIEDAIYRQALELVDRYFPPIAQVLGRMVYGKRAASSLYALAQTLQRRHDGMGAPSAVDAILEADPYEEDESAREEAEVIAVESTSVRAERKDIDSLLGQIRPVLLGIDFEPSKWTRLTEETLAPYGIVPGGSEQAVLFTEYADTAEWVTSRLVKGGFSAQMYSGRQSHTDRENVRARFMRGDFQIIVSTDAGNEGIDLQSAHVLVNYDIPWSLVRLEQRMGRIHRVGQARSVELFNLVATGTLEGETLLKLLDNFVNAANELDGQLFDSLSLVADITGVKYEEWLKAFYQGDEARREQVLEAVSKVTAIQLRRAGEQARAQEAVLASKVDAVAALSVRQRDMLDRVNPAIVEAYLSRLAGAGILTRSKTALGDGILLLQRDQGLPKSLGGDTKVRVATSGEALIAAGLHADASRVVALGPGEPAFRDLIALAAESLSADVYRGGVVEDPTTVTDYDLYAFEATLTEASGKRKTPWGILIRVDPTGEARAIRWEALANLVATNASGSTPHPGRRASADEAARKAAADIEANQRRVREDWFATARKDLEALPVQLTKDVADHQERLSMRARLAEQSALRLTQLLAMSDVRMSVPHLVSYVQVRAVGSPLSVEQADSEMVAMVHVRDHLVAEGWHVGDVHAEGRGYDLHAVLGPLQRLVEVKGVWESAASQGIRMTGNELLIATQHRRDYWLYVVDECSDGKGSLFGRYPDPATLFASDVKTEAIFKVPGSALKAARDRGER
jgi:superfamily II DNA or RNA helicase